MKLIVSIIISLCVIGGFVCAEIDASIHWGYDKELTIYNTKDTFRPYDTLSRQEGAKFLVGFAQVMQKAREDDSKVCIFDDLHLAIADLQYFIVSACQRGIFLGYNNIFSPQDVLTRAQFFATVIRVLEGPKREDTAIWYQNYFTRAQELGLTIETDIYAQNRPVLRYEAMLILYRSAASFSFEQQSFNMHEPYIRPLSIDTGTIQDPPAIQDLEDSELPTLPNDNQEENNDIPPPPTQDNNTPPIGEEQDLEDSELPTLPNDNQEENNDIPPPPTQDNNTPPIGEEQDLENPEPPTTIPDDDQEQEDEPMPMVEYQMQSTKNIPYAVVGGQQLLLDVHQPVGYPGLSPVLIWVHGGGWVAGSKNGVPEKYITDFVSHGYTVVVPNYRLAPSSVFPAQIHDIKAVVRLVRKFASDYSVDSQRIFVLGVSAGGTIAATVGTTNSLSFYEGSVGGLTDYSSDVTAVVAIASTVNFVPESRSQVNQYSSSSLANTQAYMGCDFEKNNNTIVGYGTCTVPLLESVSPYHQVHVNTTVPFLLLYGSYDTTVPLIQGQLFADKLSQHTITNTLIQLPVGHALAPFMDASLQDIIQRLDAIP